MKVRVKIITRDDKGRAIREEMFEEYRDNVVERERKKKSDVQDT